MSFTMVNISCWSQTTSLKEASLLMLFRALCTFQVSKFQVSCNANSSFQTNNLDYDSKAGNVEAHEALEQAHQRLHLGHHNKKNNNAKLHLGRRRWHYWRQRRNWKETLFQQGQNSAVKLQERRWNLQEKTLQKGKQNSKVVPENSFS